MNKAKRVIHLMIMLLFIVLEIGALLSACGRKDMAVPMLIQHLAELQVHPLPPHSEGEFSIKSPLQREKCRISIWSDGAYKTRIEYKGCSTPRAWVRKLFSHGSEASYNSRKGDFIVIDYTKGELLTYYHASNTYSMMNLGKSLGVQSAQSMEELSQIVKGTLEAKAFEYDGTTRIAGEKAYEFEIDYGKIDPSAGFDKVRFWVDTEHWCLLALEAYNSTTTMKWQTRKGAFDAHPDQELFALTPPSGASQVQPAWQKGTRPIKIEEMKKVLGRDPLLPHWLPKGYEMVEVRTGSGANASVGILYRKHYLLGTKDLTIEEIVLHGKSSPLGIANCKKEKTKVHGKEAVYSNCKVGKSLMWNEDGLQIMISGFESKSTLLKVAESMR